MTRRRFPVGKTLLYVFMSLWALTTIYPFIWVILNSFKPRGLIRSDTFSLPVGDKFTLENYVTAFKRVDIGTAYVNSIVISGAVTVVVMVLAGLAAYAMVRYSFRLRGFLHSMIIASMMFPVFSTIIPVFRSPALPRWASSRFCGATTTFFYRCFSCAAKNSSPSRAC